MAQQDNEPTLASRRRRSDAREIQSYYQQYYNQYVKALDGAEHSDRLVIACNGILGMSTGAGYGQYLMEVDVKT